MYRSIQLDSPAKVNRSLAVLRRRPDSYHELVTHLQAIDLCDQLTIELCEDRDVLTCTDPSLPMDKSNLVNRALELYREYSGLRFCASIHLHKIIPSEAGLGGGSGNAATTLWGLNQLLGAPFSDLVLRDLASDLGSDVPFFLSSGSALCMGRGERVQSFPAATPEYMTIVKPSVGLSTPRVYSALASYSDEAKDWVNDLEAPAFKILPFLARLKEELLASGYSRVILCGSGTAFCCLGDGSIQNIPNVRAFDAKFIWRKEGSWYEKERVAV